MIQRDFTTEQEAFILSRPEPVQAKMRAYHPEAMYRLKSTGQLAQIEAYEEAKDGTCETARVTAWQAYAPELTARSVFGVPFADLQLLKPCANCGGSGGVIVYATNVIPEKKTCAICNGVGAVETCP